MTDRHIEDFTIDEVALIANALGLTINWHKEKGRPRSKYGRQQIGLYRTLLSKVDFLLAMAMPTDCMLPEALVADATMLRVDSKSIRRLNAMRKKHMKATALADRIRKGERT